MIRFDHLSFRYTPQHWIFHDLHRHLHHQGVVWVNGVSGRGKSTFLALINQHLRPTSGKVVNSARRLLSFHHPFVWYPTWTIGQYLSLFGVPKGSLHRLDLHHLSLTRHVSSLSGGEQGRLYLTLLLSQTADVYLLDEPCSGLNVSHQQHVIDWIVEKSHSSLMIVASHVQRWKHVAHLALLLLQDGLSRWEDLQPYPNRMRTQKVDHTIHRMRLPLRSKRILFQLGKLLSLFGLWTFSVGVFAIATMQTHQTLATYRSWMMQIERFESIPIDNSPYVLTQTFNANEQEIRELFAFTPHRFIGKDLSPLFPTRLEVNMKNYSIVWYDQPYDAPLTLIQGQGPDRLDEIIWNHPFVWVDENHTIQWDTSFPIVITSWDDRQGPWEGNYLFFSYQGWYHHLRQYELWESLTLIQALEQGERPWPMVISIHGSTYHRLNDVLMAEGYRVRHPYVDAFHQRLFIFQTLQQWFIVLSALLICVLFFLHWTHHHLHSKEIKPLFVQSQRMGIPISMLFASIFHFDHLIDGLFTTILSLFFSYVLWSLLHVDIPQLSWFFSWLIWSVYVGMGVVRGIEKKAFYGYFS